MPQNKLLNATFKSDFADSLTGDQSKKNSSRATPDVLYALVDPTPVASPKLLAWSSDLARELELSDPLPDERAAVAEILGGNQVIAGMRPYAARYGGHQFGHWAGQLGDGRAITLGELKTSRGASRELQLKGAGPTPYSRRADGRAVLRSSLREFLCSEATASSRNPDHAGAFTGDNGRSCDA